jgi:two-component system response regulator AlgR
MNVLIVDDQPLARLRIARLIEKLRPDYTLLQSAENAQQAMLLSQQTMPDLVLLDIEMPDMSGVELAQQLKAVSPPPAIIFVTAYPDKALSAFTALPQGYLVKPVTEKALDSVLQGLNQPHRAHTVLKQQVALGYIEQGVKKYIYFSNIRVIRSEDKYIRVYTQQKSILIDGSLKYLIAKYSTHLLRIHRNTLVNKAFLSAVHLENGKHWLTVSDYTTKLEISRREWPKIKKYLR